MPATVRRHTIDIAGCEVPVVDVAGSGDGPKLTVIAGVHGCEYASMAGVRAWAAGLAQRELRGSVRAVPVLNLPAFEARSPFVIPADGKNLNRHFPGNPSGSFTERFAHAAFGALIAGADAVIDAHCGDQPEALEPFALYDAGPAQERAAELAVAYGLGYVIRQEPGPDRAVAGTTSAAAAELGIPAITAEAGGCGLVEPAAVEMHVRGLNRVLAQLGMSDEPPPSLADAGLSAPIRLSRFIWMRCAHAGWWEPAVRPGESVAQGQVLGTVSTIDGAELLQTIEAPTDGVPMFITSSPAVVADGLLLGLGAR
ncbi:MAG TPA: succinylglutamate desuccinylase/aspartoacylase family protein [Streptosporangiaceae bacterium]|nr:succinylglutamate desuccinylase/aspartoacylase family protein [Streptosporangiaceae bacterium]